MTNDHDVLLCNLNKFYLHKTLFLENIIRENSFWDIRIFGEDPFETCL